MRTVRNITVAVDPELYRQTRWIAAASATPATPAINIPTPGKKQIRSVRLYRPVNSFKIIHL
jgi:hypothetical protein